MKGTKRLKVTFAERVIDFNSTVDYRGELPGGIGIMNPFRGDGNYTLQISSQFYRKYYSDNNLRHIIIGINPGRFGAGFTGVPFTDTKRLTTECGIAWEGRQTHELSSVFVYDMIRAFGGPEKFYSHFYINSVSPLGLIVTGPHGKVKNYNYYDRPDLTAALYDFMVDNIRKQIALGIDTGTAFCLGSGKNMKFLTALNEKYHFFGKIIPLEHPRYIMQYRSKMASHYIDRYLELLGSVISDTGR